MNGFRLLISCAALAVAFAGKASEPVRHVRPEMGTMNVDPGARGCEVSNGNLYPLVARPWGFGGWSPQTRPGGSGQWFYDYADRRLYGLRYTRQPSPWINDHGAWSFLPVVGEPASNAQERCSSYSHKAEAIGPDRYRVYIADFDVSAQLAPTLHGAVVAVTYPAAETPGLVIDPFAYEKGEVHLAEDGRALVGTSRYNGNRRNLGAPVVLHFRVEPDHPVVATERLKDGALYVRFAPTAAPTVVTLRLANSFISEAQCRANLSESEGRTFAQVADEARAEWNDRLGRIAIESGDADALRTFYTCFYRTMLFPQAVWEREASGKVVHWSPATGETRPGHYYAGTGFWDTFRALFPLLNLLAPEMNAKMMEGLQHCYEESGWLPEWSSPGLSDCMIGNNSASVVADAWLSGVRGDFDINVLWQALVQGANNTHPKFEAVGRAGVADYNRLGYVPRDGEVGLSAARTLEYAYDDWCIAELGSAIGRPASEVDLYRRRAGNWRNVFDPARKIACGRNRDGSFNRDFNPFAWGGDFVEGCAHHYTWSVFHDVKGLVSAMGGPHEFERRLDEIFTLPPVADWSFYGFPIHEFREMQVMGFGQYAHGNQPIQHMIYLYDWCGAWPKAQRWSRQVMDRLYRPTPDGYCGDEDNGQTSAWYVWSALGMYPVCPSSGVYALGAPRFDVLSVTLPDGAKLRIEAKGAESGTVFDTVRLGKPLADPFVRLADLRRGCTLSFGRAERSDAGVAMSDAEKHDSAAMNETAYAARAQAEGGLKVLFVGNSITLHGPHPKIGWTNNWGMAASAPEKDFVHLVTRDLERRLGRKADLTVRNYADFERNFRQWDWKKTEELARIEPDVLVIALGENVQSLAREADMLAWRDAFKKLVGTFLDGRRTKPIAVVRGTFWPDVNKDWAMSRVASDYAIPFVKADVYPQPGMDAKDSGFAHLGIQAHPGDRGMAEIAARILKGLFPE